MEKDNLLHVEGVYDPRLRFAFTNITAEDFVSAWDGSPIIVPAGMTVELPHHLAVKLTKELVDKVMTTEFKAEEDKADKPYYRSPRGASLGVPAARKIYEDKIVRLLEVDEESPQVQVLRAQIKSELMADINRSKEKTGSVSEIHIPTSGGEFADITKPSEKASAKQPMRVKTIK